MSSYRSLFALVFVTLCQLFVAEEYGYFENYYEEIDPDSDAAVTRNAIRWDVLKWPNRRIPYTYDDDYTPAQRETVDRALQYFNEHTCVRFERRNDTRNSNGERVVRFTSKGNRCGTKVGYQANPATAHYVYMSPLCLTIPGAVQHESMHVMGIFHEQCRSDRDQYVKIDWNNIDLKNYHNFIKVPTEYAKSYDIPYDYGSIMHYSGYAFAKDRQKPTISARHDKENPHQRLGQLDKPSEGDILKINEMYRCGT